MKEIQLTRGHVATVDDHNYDRMSRHKWRYSTKGYAVRTEYMNGKTYDIRMHREIMNIIDPDIKIDHRNLNKLCNEEWNLRISTTKQNNINRPPSCKNKTSKYKGVRKYKKKWAAQIMNNHKNMHIGYFNTEILAAIAYDEKAKELFGEFASLNHIV